MGVLARWFGQCGIVRFEGVTVEGQEFEGTIDVECFNIGNEKLHAFVANAIFVNLGYNIQSLNLVGFLER